MNSGAFLRRFWTVSLLEPEPGVDQVEHADAQQPDGAPPLRSALYAPSLSTPLRAPLGDRAPRAGALGDRAPRAAHTQGAPEGVPEGVRAGIFDWPGRPMSGPACDHRCDLTAESSRRGHAPPPPLPSHK